MQIHSYEKDISAPKEIKSFKNLKACVLENTVFAFRERKDGNSASRGLRYQNTHRRLQSLVCPVFFFFLSLAVGGFATELNYFQLTLHRRLITYAKNHTISSYEVNLTNMIKKIHRNSRKLE